MPENSFLKTKEKIKAKYGESVLKYRKKYPNKPLKVRFCPKKILQAFQ